MPLPMRPPPSTARRLMGRGLSPLSVTPFTFLVDRCAKKMCTRALCVSSAAALPKASTSWRLQDPAALRAKHTSSHVLALWWTEYAWG